MSRILQMWEGMTGTILPYALGTAPSGWLLCDGTALTSGTAEHLRQALLDAGNPYGDDGSGNPLLPDLRGRHALGAGTGPSLTARALGDTGGEEGHALSVDEMPEHDHPMDTDSVGTAGSDGSAPVASGTGSTAVQSGLTGSGDAHNNMPPFVVVNHIIKM